MSSVLYITDRPHPSPCSSARWPRALILQERSPKSATVHFFLKGPPAPRGGEATRRHPALLLSLLVNAKRKSNAYNGTVSLPLTSCMLASRVADCVRYNGGASLHTTQAAGSRASPCAWVSVSALLGTPAALRSATIAVRPRRSATSRGERPSLSLVATLAPRAKSSGTTRSMPAAAARCKKLVA